MRRRLNGRRIASVTLWWLLSTVSKWEHAIRSRRFTTPCARTSMRGGAMAITPGTLQQAAAIPVRLGQVCLISSRNGKRWASD